MKAVSRGASDLEAVVAAGDLKALRRALMAGADPDQLGRHQWPPTWEAIRRGRADLLELLLAYQASLAPVGLPEGTLLHVAAFWGTPECIDVLLAAGADVLAVDPTGETPLCQAVRAANVDNVRRLLEAQMAAIPPPDTPEGTVPTLVAEDEADDGGRLWVDPDGEAEKLAVRQWRAGGPDADAAWQCALLVARYRLAAANPDVEITEREVLLQYHVCHGDASAVETVLADGANPMIRDATVGWSLLASAVDRGDPQLVRLLLEAGAEPDWYGYYTWDDTPLTYAAREGHREICALLLGAGADPDIPLGTGLTAADVTQDPVIRDLLAAAGAREISRRQAPSRGVCALLTATALLIGATQAVAEPWSLDAMKALPQSQERGADAGYVRASGCGATSTAARDEAVRLALQTTMRQLVVVERAVQNDDVVLDRMTSTLNGFVADVREIGMTREGGQVCVEADVKVSASRIANYLGSTTNPASAVRGGALAAELSRAASQATAVRGVLARAFRGFPSDTVQVAVTGVGIGRDGNTIELDCDVSFDAAWLEALEGSQAALAEARGTLSGLQRDRLPEHQGHIVCVGDAQHCYRFSEAFLQELVRTSDGYALASLLRGSFWPDQLLLVGRFLDRERQVTHRSEDAQCFVRLPPTEPVASIVPIAKDPPGVTVFRRGAASGRFWVSEREVDWAATDRVVATVALDRATACSDTAKAVTRAVHHQVHSVNPQR